jgi:7,8-dihydropterin-6-yl-methyl-4-(beta-D-ribofuranosyl)aminobenzene 5'-phosphate synthase
MRIVNLIENTAGIAGCIPLHGLSFYVETVKHRILFDAGPNDELLRNAERLGVDLKKVDIAVLSHGHYDHSGGLLAFARINPSATIYVQSGVGGEHYGYDGVDKGYRYIGIDKKLLELPQVRLVDGDVRIDDELSLFCVQEYKYPIPSTNARIMKKISEVYQPDDFRHEQNLYIRAEKETVLLSGCAHSGILNVLEEFQRKFGSENLPGKVISGFHLLKKNGYEPSDLAEYNEIAQQLSKYPCMFYTCHCTGIEPYDQMKTVLGDRLLYIRTGECIEC